MKKPQWISVLVAILVVIVLYAFGRTVPRNNEVIASSEVHSADDGHDHGDEEHAGHASEITIDTILNLSRKQLTSEQVLRLNSLENSVKRGDVNDQQLHVYHQLARFWRDSARVFEPYAWYEAQAARLENSEKTLTFAAHLFLENLQQDRNPAAIKWKALQAKDLFERSLKLNPGNDSSKVGLGACYLFGNISDAPMEGIALIREVADRDSTHIFAQLVLARGAVFSGQYDRAIGRLETVNRVQPANMEALLMLADINERTGNKKAAISWYQKCLPYINRPDAKEEIEKRIALLQ